MIKAKACGYFEGFKKTKKKINKFSSFDLLKRTLWWLYRYYFPSQNRHFCSINNPRRNRHHREIFRMNCCCVFSKKLGIDSKKKISSSHHKCPFNVQFFPSTCLSNFVCFSVSNTLHYLLWKKENTLEELLEIYLEMVFLFFVCGTCRWESEKRKNST